MMTACAAAYWATCGIDRDEKCAVFNEKTYIIEIWNVSSSIKKSSN